MWDIPCLRADRLSSRVPTSSYSGGSVSDPEHALFLWRTARLSTARGMTAGFYVWDDKLEGLWRQPEHATARLLSAGVAAVIEPDFSLWVDAPLVEQLWNVYRMRALGRHWQEAGLNIIPNLSWSDERSFSFCFAGIPVGAPVVATECRTAGGNDSDRRAFLRGLREGVKQVQPQHVVVYGGREHAYWLTGHLPEGPEYTLLESWTRARGRICATQARREQAKHQLNLFGGEQWADEEAQAA